jgi:glycosidase
MKKEFIGILLLSGLFFAACNSATPEVAETETVETAEADPLDWVKNANIYEVNVRQYSAEGDFKGFEQHLTRLKEMGVDILWFMPIYPISEARRKGTLGSYYAIADYTAVNPNFGTMEEFKALVDKIHSMGMKVILDWVPNHTGWDHAWITEHPEYYTKNKDGEITDPIKEDGESWGWTDVADLDYSNQEMRKSMIEEMKFWLSDVDVDGFRCDVAGEVPDDFWAEARPALDAVKPVFMLAEAEHAPHRNEGHFHMSYGWSFHHLMNDIAQGKKNASDIDAWNKEYREEYKKGWAMHFLTNHDENSWNGTIEERMGDAHKALGVLAFTFEGMPLIYSGQEAGLNKRLEFFEKDEIDWSDLSLQPFYQKLLTLKHENPALWNGSHGGVSSRIETTNDEAVYAYSREKDGRKIVVVINLTNKQQEVELKGDAFVGDYDDIFANSTLSLTQDMTLTLEAYNYLVLSK